MIEQTNKSKIVQLDEYLANQRSEWTSKIKELTQNLKEGINLEEVSAYTLSYRQILVENLATIGGKIRTQKGTVDKLYKQKWIEYYKFDYKITDKQREKFIEVMEFMQERVKVFELQGEHDYRLRNIYEITKENHDTDSNKQIRSIIIL